MLRFELERFLFGCARILARAFPRSWVLAAGRTFGYLAFLLDVRHRKVALKNYEIAFPEATAEQARDTVCACYKFFGHSVFDLLTFFPRMRPAHTGLFEYQGLEHVDAAYARGKGAIFFTAHFGGWELMGMAHGLKGYSMGLVIRKLDNPYLNRLLDALRRSTGNFIIDKWDGFRPMLRAMREGKGIAILIDQNVTTEDRIYVDFFGRPASTTPVLGLLKLKTDAALVPAFALPLPGNRYRFIYCPPVEVPLTGDRRADVWKITQECTRVIEQRVRENPQYWLWMHRRWKTQPDSTEVQDAQGIEPVKEKV
jgi:KDO2-lipid IV(A) lauroyltransferase